MTERETKRTLKGRGGATNQANLGRIDDGPVMKRIDLINIHYAGTLGT